MALDVKHLVCAITFDDVSFRSVIVKVQMEVCSPISTFSAISSSHTRKALKIGVQVIRTTKSSIEANQSHVDDILKSIQGSIRPLSVVYMRLEAPLLSQVRILILREPDRGTIGAVG
jgi:hypothetical protein